MGLSLFASKPIEDVVAANPQTFFQLHWIASREVLRPRMIEFSAGQAASGMDGHPLPSFDDIAWLGSQWDGPFMLKGINRLDDAERAVELSATTISVPVLDQAGLS